MRSSRAVPSQERPRTGPTRSPSVPASSPSRSSEFPKQPRASDAPLALHGLRRDGERLGGLFDIEPGKESELDYPYLARTPLSELCQRGVEVQQLFGVVANQTRGFFERDAQRA